MTFDIQNGVLEKVHDCDEDVTIPDSVTSIGNNAFQNCTDLRFISLPKLIKTIGNNSFCGCSSLKILSIPECVTRIGSSLCENCSSLLNVSFSCRIDSIPRKAFKNCSSLRFMSIPDGVKNIGDEAFGNCTALESISIPESTTLISKNAFRECRLLKILLLSRHHLKMLRSTLRRAEVIRCIAPIDEIPLNLRRKCCLGFAMSEKTYPSEMREGYLRYIRRSVRKLLKSTLKYPALLQLLLREKLLTDAQIAALNKKALLLYPRGLFDLMENSDFLILDATHPYI